MTGETSPPNPLFERWGVLKLEDGLRLWVRTMLVYVSTEKGPPVSQQLRVFTAMVTEADSQFKGEPTSGPVNLSKLEPVRSYDSVEVVNSAESFYQLPNGVVLSLKLKPQRARRYNVFGADRDPIIQVDHLVEMGTVSTEGTPVPNRIELGHHNSSPMPAPI